MESMESQEAVFPPFPHSLEIRSRLPHSHSLDSWHISRCKSMRNRIQRPLDLKGVVIKILGVVGVMACLQQLQRLHYPSISSRIGNMTIFREMHEARVVVPGWDYRELLRMLSEAIARGHVEQVPVMKLHRYAPRRTWYLRQLSSLRL
jgi:hypothetical protein